MEPDQDAVDGKEDVDMLAPPTPETQDQASPQMEDPALGEEEAVTRNVSQELAEPVASLKSELPLRTGKYSSHSSSSATPAPVSVLTGTADVPPLNQQVKTIETIVKAFAETPLKEGDKVYLVSRQWLNRAQAFGADAKHASKESLQGGLGPVDNADIIQAIFIDSNGQACVKLRPGMGVENFEPFPKDAWDLLMSWYGLAPGQSPIERVAHNTAPDATSMPNIQFEYHPPVFTIHRLWSATSPIPIDQEIKSKKPAPPVIVQSSAFSFNEFLKQAKTLTSVSLDHKIRLWRLLQTIPTEEDPVAGSQGMKTPPDSPGRDSTFSTLPPLAPGAWPEMLVDVETFTKLERDQDRSLIDTEDTSANRNYNGRKSLALVGLTVDQTLVIDESVEGGAFVSTYKGGSLKDKTLATRGSSGSLAAQVRANASGRSSPAIQGPLTRGRAQQKSGRVVGSVGLQNLGNTCYMNSALQCVRSVEELTKYFLTNEAAKEINPDNPLSHNGEVADAYKRLLFDIYKDPAPTSVAPRYFKSVIGKYAPAFSGYGQQDSQEFLGFLLDGLQEDLNRIKKKPYIEKPDSTDDMINNPAAIREMAEKVWDITKKRDDSVIADLFTGMYKSTLVCPVCEKVSITFDPFNNLTLPLPVANVWSRTVKYFPLNDYPVEISVDIDKNSSIKALKQFISVRVGVPIERLFGAEEFREKFFKFYDDLSSVSDEIQSNDQPMMYELEAAPTNVSGAKKAKNKRTAKSLLSDGEDEENTAWDDPMAERLLVPVLHRLNPEEPGFRKNRYNRAKSSSDLPPPHFIVLTPTEARNEDIIRRKVLEKMATFSTWSEFSAADEADAAENTDPEMLNTVSDVDETSDSKIVAKSVEGEEDIRLKEFNHRRPRWINPLEFLDPNFQNLFELSYFTEPDSLMPTGWNSIQDDNLLPRLSTRQPKPIVSDIEMRSPAAWEGSEDSGSEKGPGLGPSHANVNNLTRMADESSEEDSSDYSKVAPRLQATKNQVSARAKQMKSKTYGKKAKKRLGKQQRAVLAQPQNRLAGADYATGFDNGPLIRLGEGLIVDWNESAFEAVFGGTVLNGMAGMKTYQNVPTLEDPALDAMRKQRTARRKNGITLDDCLAEFEKEEILSEQDTWYCPRCKEHRRASKKFDLWKTPDILVVHLKRFSSSGYRRDKLDILVDFPVEGLDLTTRVIDKEDGKQEVYDLIAVDDHWGGLGGGHYTAFARNFVDGQFYEFNDSSVSLTKDTKRMVTSAAYLLFYRRRSETPLGGPRFQEIFERYESLHSADEDMEDSGEGQRLGQGSSLRGSPSALTGAGLTHPRGKRGLASSHADINGLLTSDADTELPSYPSILSQVGDDDDIEMDTPLQWNQQGTLHNSIEGDGEDEGIGLPEFANAGPGAGAGITSVLNTGWSFTELKAAETSLEDDIASDVAQNDNSSVDAFADQADEADAMNSMLRLAAEEPGSEYIEPAEPQQEDYTDFEDIAPPPLVEDSDYMTQLATEAWMKNQVHTVPADIGDDVASDKVAEIHVGDEQEQQGHITI
ncbi:hypothetical protein B0H63DRAFT_534187 [Podospora didyma]|uniref:ubiquitinyl hydrolase 1 n=1 Tax=Podospora didyma TaxID=330526 RepID=A0AAE0K1A4_9PEZI|nr:hypothetical protein B0H63DRAFT_534187 [Podospora didyma]